MSNEAEKILHDVLARVQRNDRLRKAIAGLAVLGLLGLALYFAFDMLPRSYALRITGGDLLSNRHFLAKSLQAEAVGQSVALQVIPTPGSQEALEQVQDRRLDMAFIQGGLEADHENVTHVATVATELLHFLVREDITNVAHLRGKRVNLGGRKGGTRVIAREVLGFSGLDEGVDYTETNLSSETLVALPLSKLPEAVVITSFAPSDVADFLVKERGYRLLEIPFPRSLALRLGWVAESQITAYMYQVTPAVPPKDIQAIGVHLHLVAHKDVEPRAVFKVLESLYSPGLEVRMRMRFDEEKLTLTSGYPLAAGSALYLARNNPLLSTATLDRIKALFGLVLSVVSTFLVVFRWFMGSPPPPQAPEVKGDAQLLALMAQTAQAERDYEQALTSKTPGLDAIYARVTTLRDEAYALVGATPLDNPQLAPQLMQLLQHLLLRMEAHRHA